MRVNVPSLARDNPGNQAACLRDLQEKSFGPVTDACVLEECVYMKCPELATLGQWRVVSCLEDGCQNGSDC